MTPKFLREQATYLRDIADLTDLKNISKPTLLTLAEDYEALAKATEKATADEVMVRARRMAKELNVAA